MVVEYTYRMSETILLRRAQLNSLDFATISQVSAARKAAAEPTLSFEFFPPKDEAGAVNLWNAFQKLLEVSPDFVSVTYGAGGSNRERSLAVVDRMAKRVLTIGHLTCVGATEESTLEIVRHFENAGVGAILALRGDAPKDDPDALGKGDLKTALGQQLGPTPDQRPLCIASLHGALAAAAHARCSLPLHHCARRSERLREIRQPVYRDDPARVRRAADGFRPCCPDSQA